MRIHAVTPNPALDLSGHVHRIVANEKNYVLRTRLDPGGNGINAARIATRLGARAVLMGFLGGGAGDQLRELLDVEGLPSRFTRIRGVTRTNVTVTNDHDHKQTRLTFPGPTISRREAAEFRDAIARLDAPGLLLLGGSAPPGLSGSFYAKVIATAARRGLGTIVDVPAKDLTRIFRQSSVKLLLIKPNQTELEELSGKTIRSDAALAAAAAKLARHSALVCVSLAERGAIFAMAGRAWFAAAPRVKARGTVGAGDSMVGAMAARLAHFKLARPELLEEADEEKLLDVFRWGVAAGAATAASEGTSLGDPALIRRLAGQVTIRPIPLRAASLRAAKGSRRASRGRL